MSMTYAGNRLSSTHIPSSLELTRSFILSCDDDSEGYDDDEEENDEEENEEEEERSADECELASVLMAKVVHPDVLKAEPRSGSSKKRMDTVGTFILSSCSCCRKEERRKCK
jgi:hypothetical protein